MLLDWLGNRHGLERMKAAGRAIEGAVDAVLANPARRTVDLGGNTGTRAFADAVVAQLEPASAGVSRAA
jgi:3-isopropylmalate dehydrogenase